MTDKLANRKYKVIDKLESERYGEDIINSVKSVLATVEDVYEGESQICLDEAVSAACETCIPIFDHVVKSNAIYLDTYAGKAIIDGFIALDEHSFTFIRVLRGAWHLLMEDSALAEVPAICYNIIADRINYSGHLDQIRPGAVPAIESEIDEAVAFLLEEWGEGVAYGLLLEQADLILNKYITE